MMQVLLLSHNNVSPLDFIIKLSTVVNYRVEEKPSSGEYYF